MAEKKSASIKFPFEDNEELRSLKRAETVEETLTSAIICFLLTDKFSRRGNPIGSILPALQHLLIAKGQISGYEAEIKVELAEQFPGVTFNFVELSQDLEDNVSNLRLKIRYFTPISEIQEIDLVI